jgi:hypothetical protein
MSIFVFIENSQSQKEIIRINENSHQELKEEKSV